MSEKDIAEIINSQLANHIHNNISSNGRRSSNKSLPEDQSKKSPRPTQLCPPPQMDLHKKQHIQIQHENSDFIKITGYSEEFANLEKKIGYSLSMMFANEIRFNREVENRRLTLFSANQLSPLFYFKLIDINDCGYIDYGMMTLFMKKENLRFSIDDWIF